MGFFDGLLTVINEGVNAFLSNAALTAVTAVGVAVALLAGLPLLAVGAALAVSVIIVGVLATRKKCQEKVAKIVEVLNEVFRQYGSVTNILPNDVRIEQVTATVTGAASRVRVKVSISFNRVIKLRDVQQYLQSVLKNEGIEAKVIGPLDDWVIPVGNVSFNSAYLQRYALVRNKYGVVYAENTGRVGLSIGSAVFTFKVPECDVCCGGADELIDKYAREQGYGFVRKLLFWSSPELAATGQLTDTFEITVRNAVMPGDVVELVYGSPMLLYQFWRMCHSKSLSDQEKSVCRVFNSQTVCPYGQVFLPELFVGILKEAGYADWRIVREAKLISTSLPTTTQLVKHTLSESEVIFKNQRALVVVRHGDKTQTIDLTKQAVQTGGMIESDNVAYFFSTYPYSLRAELVISTQSFGNNSGFASIVVDPLGIVYGELGGTADSLPKVVAKDAYGKKKVLYLQTCYNHVAMWDESKKAIVIRGPAASVAASAVYELANAYLSGELSQVSCPLLEQVLYLAGANDCIKDKKIVKGCIRAY